MTTYYYSSQTNCLYMDGIPPDGSVEITETYYQELITGMQNGKVIASDEKGYPILVDAPPPTAEDNKATASSLLAGTDWTTIADVASPTNNPYLGNQADFIAYRNVIRAIAVYPPAGEIVWATPPTEVWLQGE